MKAIWIVTFSCGYETHDIVGVYDSEEKARAACTQNSGFSGQHDVEEWEVK